MNEIVFTILKCIITVAAILVARYVIPYLKSLTANNQYALACDIVTVAVNAVEQTITGKKQGDVKKETVLESVKAELNRRGIEITAAQLDELIEAAVFELNKPDKE